MMATTYMRTTKGRMWNCGCPSKRYVDHIVVNCQGVRDSLVLSQAHKKGLGLIQQTRKIRFAFHIIRSLEILFKYLLANKILK